MHGMPALVAIENHTLIIPDTQGSLRINGAAFIRCIIDKGHGFIAADINGRAGRPPDGTACRGDGGILLSGGSGGLIAGERNSPLISADAELAAAAQIHRTALRQRIIIQGAIYRRSRGGIPGEKHIAAVVLQGQRCTICQVDGTALGRIGHRNTAIGEAHAALIAAQGVAARQIKRTAIAIALVVMHGSLVNADLVEGHTVIIAADA